MNSNMEPETTRIDRQAFDRFQSFIREREAVRIRRKSNFEAPWTEDKILQSYHFTNIKREHDKVSKYLFEKWYPSTANGKNPSNAWAAIMVARFVNNPDSLSQIAYEVGIGDFKNAWRILRAREESGEKVFRSAYLQPEIRGVKRLEKIFGIFVPQVQAADIRTDSVEEAVEDLCKIKYFGEFMAGQMALDAIHVVKGHWADRFTFAPIGPGSTRGLNRLRNLPLTRKLKRRAYETEMAELHTCPGMNEWRALDLEHALCEWDKYERLRLNQGSYNRKR